MNPSKEQKQKLVICGIFAIILIYAYFEYGLGPLKRKQDSALKEISVLTPQLADAQMKMKSRDTLKARIPQAEAFLTQIDRMIPDGAPVAWFPTLIGDYFKSRGNERVTTRMLNEVADPAVEGYKRISWSVEVPKIDAIEFANILSDFENQQPLVECPSIIVEFNKEEPQYQKVVLNLTNSVKK
jgi:hypothetical protein